MHFWWAFSAGIIISNGLESFRIHLNLYVVLLCEEAGGFLPHPLDTFALFFVAISCDVRRGKAIHIDMSPKLRLKTATEKLGLAFGWANGGYQSNFFLFSVPCTLISLQRRSRRQASVDKSIALLSHLNNVLSTFTLLFIRH